MASVFALGSVTAGPDGSFSTNVTIPASATPGVYQVVFSGYDQQGNPHKAYGRVEVVTTVGPQGSTSTAAGGGGGNCSGGTSGQQGSGGHLAYTGTDTRTLLLVGTGAVVAGRTLYALRNRLAAAPADGDAHSR